MGVSSHHPDYDKLRPIWDKCRDVQSQEAIIAGGTKYLDKLVDETKEGYLARRERAGFFGASGRTVQGLKGMIHRKEPKLQPDEHELFDDVTGAGVSLGELLRKGTKEALELTRFGLFVDHPVVPPGMTRADVADMDIRPTMHIIKAENVINWRETRINGKTVLSLVVIAETKEEVGEDEFVVESSERFRVLDLHDGSYRVRIFVEQDGKDVQIGGDTYPLMSGKKMDYIPFFPYPSLTPVKPAMLDLFNVNIGHYKTLADYEHGCHHTAIITGFITGHRPEAGQKIYLGGPSFVCLPEAEAKAFLLESKNNLGALRENLEAKEKRMAVLGARMLEQQQRQVEAAETAALHRSGESSSLADVAIHLGNVFTKGLRVFLEWAGTPQPDAVVELNRDYMPVSMSPQLVTAMLQAVQAGEMSSEAYFDNLQKGELYPDSLTYEDEQGRRDNQAPPFPGE